MPLLPVVHTPDLVSIVDSILFTRRARPFALYADLARLARPRDPRERVFAAVKKARVRDTLLLRRYPGIHFAHPRVALKYSEVVPNILLPCQLGGRMVHHGIEDIHLGVSRDLAIPLLEPLAGFNKKP